MTRQLRLATLLGWLIAIPGAASAATAMVGASRDNTIYQSAVNNSGGGAAGIFVGGNGQGSPRRGLIAFDVAASVPAGATITSAALTLRLASSPPTGNQTIELHRLTRDWGEGSAGSTSPSVGGAGNGFPAANGDATWEARFYLAQPPAPWSAPGADGDFVPAASASAIVGDTLALLIPFTWMSPAMISDVQGWLNNPGTNFGWALINANETNPQSVRAFFSREAAQSPSGPFDPAWRPVLSVTYVVPEPAGILMLLIAAPLLFQRAR